MILKIASYKAVKYACLNFHYAKSIPVNTFGYSVFNDENKWCGVVLFGLGASPYVSKSLGMNQGQAAELVRMALNGKQKNVSSCKTMLRYVAFHLCAAGFRATSAANSIFSQRHEFHAFTTLATFFISHLIRGEVRNVGNNRRETDVYHATCYTLG